DARLVPERRGGLEAVVSGDPECRDAVAKGGRMDPGNEPVRHPFRRTFFALSALRAKKATGAAYTINRIFPCGSCLRLVRALAAETHEGWLAATRYLNMEHLKERKKE